MDDIKIELTEELVGEFAEETIGNLTKAQAAFVSLEYAPGDYELINTAFRSFHTIKGSSDYLGMTAIKEFAHHIEDILGEVRSKKSRLNTLIITALLEACDTLKTEAAQLKRPGKFDMERFNFDVSVIYKDFIMKTISNKAGKSGMEPDKNSNTGAYDFSPENAPREELEIRIGSERLNSFMANLGEILALEPALRFSMAETAAQFPEKSALIDRSFSRFSRSIDRLKSSAYGLKMLPLKNAFMKMSRLIRDLSVKSGKKLRLITSGGNVEMDREIVESIAEPMMHLIRNACDHGIETALERRVAGKPEHGFINISASMQEGNVIINISDDGGGIDKNKVLKKAVEAGLARENAALNDEDIFKLIMAPGFSTAEKITDISGRGVGMDVVARAVNKLGGSVKIKSIPGQGTRVSMKLPVLLAVIEAVVVQIENEKYALPAENTLYAFCGTHDPEDPETDEIKFVDLSAGRCSSGMFVTVESGGKKRALKVDRVLAPQPIAVKKIHSLKLENTIFSGATVLADGQPALIISPDKLVNAET
ncbi:MAG: ATP-binding protein [Candidatus Goldiibacteriota bacterium]|jgi:two-component system chemotaxis sensor kinase CheA